VTSSSVIWPEAVVEADDHHAEVQQVGDDREQGGLLAAVLGGGRGEGPADLAVQRAARPQAAGLVEERRHLRGHAAKARAGADDDRVVVGQLVDGGDRGFLVELEVGALATSRRHGFRHALDVDGRAGFAGAFGHGLGHRLDVAVGRIIENENLGHVGLLRWSGEEKSSARLGFLAVS
jgi:hypothetical protein